MAGMLIGVVAEFARAETELLSIRTISGMAEARRKGKTIGRPVGIIQTDKEIQEKYPGVVRDLRKGLTIRQTAATRKVSVATVQKVKKALN
jgi:DNA invertase Pin-like site-specific DNA recombinase